MPTEDRALALLDVIRQGLLYAGERQTQAMLGNRHDYLGMSDNGLTDDKPKRAAPIVSMVGNSKWAQNRAANG